MICSIYLPIFQILVIFIETHLSSFGTDLLGIYWYLSFFFQFSAGIFPLHLNDFESTNIL